jgi:hypothetical protein
MISDLRNCKQNKKFKTIRFLGCAPKVLLAKMEAQLDGSGRRILLGDGTEDAVIMLRPVRFQCVGVCISSELPCIYVYI